MISVIKRNNCGKALDIAQISRDILGAMAFCPPLIITSSEVAEALDIVERSLDTLLSNLGPGPMHPAQQR